MRNVVTLIIVDNSDGYSVAGAEDRFHVHRLNVPFGRMARSGQSRVELNEVKNDDFKVFEVGKV